MDHKLIDFTEMKAERNGMITPRAVIDSVADYMHDVQDITHLAIVVKSKDGMIHTAQSTMSYLELVGLHATAQAIAVEEMNEEF